MEITWENFENILKYHDWYYDYSDDYSVYTAGKNFHNWLINAFRELSNVDADKATEIWNKYAPENCKK